MKWDWAFVECMSKLPRDFHRFTKEGRDKMPLVTPSRGIVPYQRNQGMTSGAVNTKLGSNSTNVSKMIISKKS